MKKISIIFIVSLVFSLFNINALAANPKAALSNVALQQGESGEITLSLSDCNGFSNLGFEIAYDNTALELTAVLSNTSVGAICTTAQNYSKNPYNIGWDSTTNTNFNGVLATLTFKVLENASPGTYPIILSYYKGVEKNYKDGYDVNYDQNFNALNLGYINGSITVPERTNSISAKNVSANEQVIINATLTASDKYFGNVLAAMYASDGTLMSVKVYPASDSLNIAFDKGVKGKYVQLMWWNVLKPVCKSEIVQLN